MATRTTTRARSASAPAAGAMGRVWDGRFAAFTLLRTGFGVLAIIAGTDKFFDWMVEWPRYLWSGVVDLLPWTAQEIMYGVGGIEIAAGLLVLLAPRFGAPLVAVWLAGIVTNLVLVGFEDDRYWDIALRDFGLMVGAIALTMLAWSYYRMPVDSSRARRARR